MITAAKLIEALATLPATDELEKNLVGNLLIHRNGTTVGFVDLLFGVIELWYDEGTIDPTIETLPHKAGEA